MKNVIVTQHPFIQHKLTHLRSVETTMPNFRELLTEISMLMTYEVTREFVLKKRWITTPMGRSMQPVLKENKQAIVSILRAGNGLLEGVLKILPYAKVGIIGVYRNEKTHKPVEYYYKMPSDLHQRNVIVVDPMLATGNSLLHTLDRIVGKHPPKSLGVMCILATQKGIENIHRAHPDVRIYTACIDPKLNAEGFIVPGLGDAGDRIFGTV